MGMDDRVPTTLNLPNVRKMDMPHPPPSEHVPPDQHKNHVRMTHTD